MLATVVEQLTELDDAGLTEHFRSLELARVAANRRVNEQLADSIDVLLDQAEQLSFEDARTCLRRWESLADINGADHDRELSHEHRTATVTELDGSLYMRATGGTAETAAEMTAIFNHTLEQEFAADVTERTRLHGPNAPASLLARTDAQRRFDAMTSIFRRSINVPAGAKTPPPLVNIIVDQRTLEEALTPHGLIPEPADLPDLDLSERRCETTSGTPIHNHYTAKRTRNGQVTYHRRDGTPMLPIGRRPPPDNDDLPDEHNIEQLTHLAHERLAALQPAS